MEKANIKTNNAIKIVKPQKKYITNRNSKLSWRNPKTGKEIFGIKDIEAFDWDKQVFRLSLESAIKLIASSQVWKTSQSFAVTDGIQTIYKGEFVTSNSIKPFVGPTIHLDRHIFNSDAVAPPLFEIRGGYLGQYSDDNWNKKYGMKTVKNMYLKYMLKDSGVLKSIELKKYKPLKIVTTAIKFGTPEKLLAGMQVYCDTFIINKSSLFHLMFKKGEHFPLKANSIELLVTLNSNDQRFGAQMSYDKLPLTIIDNGYMCKFKPWNSNVVLKDVKPKPGPAEFSVMVILKDKKGTPLVFCEIPPISVEILAN